MREKVIYILGIYGGHNATASLLKDGEIIAAVSEERFNGKKNYIGFPHQSIEFLLKENGISAEELSMVVVPVKLGVPVFSEEKVQRDPLLKIAVILHTPLTLVRKIWRYIEYYAPSLHPIGRKLYEFAFRTVGKRTMKKHLQNIAKLLKIDENKVKAFEHHESHAAVAYYGSPYNKEKAIVLTIDGEGDLISSSVNIINENGDLQRIAQTSSDCSFGCVYYEVTGYLGMKRGEHEYKVMGLAPYAKDYGIDEVYQDIKDLIILDPKNKLQFKSKIDTHPHIISLYLKDKLKDKRFDNIAGAFQKLVEERLTAWVEEAIKKTGIQTICIGGGVAMNVKANLKIAELKAVKKFFACPSAGDESTTMGACYLAYIEHCKKHKLNAQIRPLKALYLGPSYSNENIEKFLQEGNYYNKYKIKKHENIEKIIAKLLSEFKIIGRMAGRMEWGARALGNRSILANPSNPDLIKIINEQMKMRDFWMPFAGSIIEERAEDYIVNPKNIPADYMAVGFESTQLAQKDLRAAMHPYDFTIRPQIVKKEHNLPYYNIIKEFEKITGIGGILNTSFNLHGLPIVLGPKEAIHAFENSGLEYLVLENYLIEK